MAEDTRTPYQKRFGPTKKHGSKSVIVPKPTETGKTCANPGCEKPAVGDEYCSRACVIESLYGKETI